VDETPADDATSYVSVYNDDKYDLYNLPAHSVGSGVINSITVYQRSRESGANGQSCSVIKTGGTVYYGGWDALTTSYQDFSEVWATNPKTGVAWTWDDIDALQIGVRLDEISGSVYVICTQVYVVIDYTVIITYDVSVTDGCKMGEVFVLQMYAYPALTEGLKGGDSPGTASTLMAVSLAEGVKMGDVVEAVKLYLLSLTEGIKMGDSSSYNMEYLLGLTEGIKLGDLASAEMQAALALTEGFKAGDSPALSMLSQVSIVEGIKLSDVLSDTMLASLSVTEGMTLGDVANAVILSFIELTVRLYGRSKTLQLFNRAMGTKLKNRSFTPQLHGRSLTVVLNTRAVTVIMREVQT